MGQVQLVIFAVLREELEGALRQLQVGHRLEHQLQVRFLVLQHRSGQLLLHEGHVIEQQGVPRADVACLKRMERRWSEICIVKNARVVSP